MHEQNFERGFNLTNWTISLSVLLVLIVTSKNEMHIIINGHGTQKTSYVIVTSLAAWRADCCLATRNNIRNCIVACVYSVARSVA
jgi:hypothetical protein